MATDAPGIGEPVTSIGFPGLNIADTDGIDFDALFSGGKTSAEVLQDSRLQPVNTSGTIIARQYRHGVAVYQVSADFDQGMSGGPTINAHGQVLGINSQMTIPFLGQNFNVITDTAPLREYLAHGQQQAASVPGDRTGPISADNRSGGELPTGWIIVIALLVGGTVGGLATLRIRRAKRGSSATGSDDNTDMEQPAALPTSG